MLGVTLFVALRFAVLHSVVKIQKKQFRHTALMQQKSEWITLTFNSEELYKDTKGVEWKENNKEIVINGKYHEVVSIEKKNGKYCVNIIDDRKENELFRDFFDKIEKKGQLTDCILYVLAMNFIVSDPVGLEQPTGTEINHVTILTLKNGIEFSARTEKPPRV